MLDKGTNINRVEILMVILNKSQQVELINYRYKLDKKLTHMSGFLYFFGWVITSIG